MGKVKYAPYYYFSRKEVYRKFIINSNYTINVELKPGVYFRRSITLCEKINMVKLLYNSIKAITLFKL